MCGGAALGESWSHPYAQPKTLRDPIASRITVSRRGAESKVGSRQSNAEGDKRTEGFARRMDLKSQQHTTA